MKFDVEALEFEFEVESERRFEFEFEFKFEFEFEFEITFERGLEIESEFSLNKVAVELKFVAVVEFTFVNEEKVL